ncbi:CIC11C00000004923 [Sungouiella intermedia]|uniref:CIC11C00000004923 n=1 Tax=Sungouiella intermedia TaxID=45354 RepID=A0A1L0BYY7_9ASCO|nr:CIC11C00000004923 [[Candida] intermedia]
MPEPGISAGWALCSPPYSTSASRGAGILFRNYASVVHGAGDSYSDQTSFTEIPNKGRGAYFRYSGPIF